MSLQAIGYRRVSTVGQSLDGTSLDTQLEAIKRYCDENDYHLLKTFTDTHSGGDLWERPGLTALRDWVRDGGVDVVVAYSLDRLSRDQTHTAVVFYEVEKMGTRIELVTERIDDNSPVGTMIRGNIAFAAEFERYQFIERSIRGRRARVKNGSPLPGPRPKYGYRWADETHTKLVPDPVTSLVVNRIFEEARQGVSLRQIAIRLTNDNVPTPSGKSRTWGQTSVRHILLDKSYIGIAKGLRWQSVKERGKTVVRPRPAEDVVTLPDGTIQPLIERQLFDVIADRLAQNKRDATPWNPNPEASLLRVGFVQCGVCGSAMKVQNSHNQYRCYKHKPSTVISRDGLDRAVWERAQWIVMSDEAHAEFETTLAAPDYSTDLTTILETMNSIERERQNLMIGVAGAKDADAITLYNEMIEDRSTRLRELEEEYTVVEDISREAWELHEFLTGFEEWRKRQAVTLASLDYKGRRNLLRDLGIEVIVRPVSADDERCEIRSRIAPTLVIRTPSSRE